MSITTLAQAKLHLRVDHADEDALIQVYLDAAEQAVADLMDRNLYADSSALLAAQSVVAATLADAEATYNAAMALADAMDSDLETQAAEDAAGEVLRRAYQTARRTSFGVAMQDDIQAAVLLLVGHLYANREATTMNVATLNVVEAPMSVRFLLQRHANYQ